VGTFTDNVFDDTATSGAALSIDNFEPWPTIDIPYTPPSAGTTVTTVGTWVTLTAAIYPSTILRWLPGTLVQIDGNVYTLRGRPFGTGPYKFEVEEDAGTTTTFSFVVNEPDVARQILPYLWGPDSTGTVFACGDPLRPGTLYYTKANNVDSAPDTNTIELCPPSEPLLGGELLNGLSYVSSSNRWWAVYPAPPGSIITTGSQEIVGGVNPYDPVEIAVGHPLATPYGHTTDGQQIYYWGKNGLYAHSGGPATPLTDADLSTIFPHEGVQGVNVTQGGQTFYAPDYSRSATFRIAVIGNYVFADYQDANGIPRTIVMDKRTGAWSADTYATPITVHYKVEQQESATLSQALYSQLVMGDTNGDLLLQGGSTDNGTAIVATFASFQWTSGALCYCLAPWSDVAYLGGPITLTITALGGQSPLPITLASVVGYVRERIYLTFNKGLSYQFSVSLGVGSAFYLVEFSPWVGQWGRSGMLTPIKGLVGGS
jgi:hypothetical protein